MKVLSLFDGMSCGQIALNESNVKIDRYYASEIDKYAISQTQLNFPNTVQLGDVTKWREWDIDWSTINLILVGSPCQGFSFAGKQLAFDDPRSKLFFVFVEILNYCKKFNPDVKFLLENVNMKKDHLRVISEYVGVFPVNINSNLVSAQNRDRWYWTNIRTKKVGLFDEVYTDIPQPKDREILLRDILEDEVDEKYFLSDTMIGWLHKHSDKSNENKNGFALKLKSEGDKLSCLTSGQYKQNLSADYIAINQRGRGFNEGGRHFDKTPTLSSCSWDQNNLLENNSQIRRLTPLECSRLQTIPSWYKWECSDTQRYRMLGNGWTVDVIRHILSFMK